MPSKRIRFIINPRSGAMHKEHFADLINSGIDKSKYEAEIVFTEYPKHATELSREAAQRGDHLVVAVGGDGSVNEAGAGLVGGTTALGIIPTGSEWYGQASQYSHEFQEGNRSHQQGKTGTNRYCDDQFTFLCRNVWFGFRCAHRAPFFKSRYARIFNVRKISAHGILQV